MQRAKSGETGNYRGFKSVILCSCEGEGERGGVGSRGSLVFFVTSSRNACLGSSHNA